MPVTTEKGHKRDPTRSFIRHFRPFECFSSFVVNVIFKFIKSNSKDSNGFRNKCINKWDFVINVVNANRTFYFMPCGDI